MARLADSYRMLRSGRAASEIVRGVGLGVEQLEKVFGGFDRASVWHWRRLGMSFKAEEA